MNNKERKTIQCLQWIVIIHKDKNKGQLRVNIWTKTSNNKKNKKNYRNDRNHKNYWNYKISRNNRNSRNNKNSKNMITLTLKKQ